MDDLRVTRDTELRKLSYYQLHQIASQMNHSKNWQQLMMIIPKDLNTTEQQPPSSSHHTDSQQATRFKYTQEHMRLIEEAASTGRLPGHILFEEWGTSGKTRPTLAHLLKLLVDANLYRAADYLAVDILNESPPARPILGPAAPIDIGSMLEDSGEDVNFDSRSITFNGTSPQREINIESRSTGAVPVMTDLFESGALVTVDSNSNAPTVSTNLASEPLMEGFSEEVVVVDIPNLSMLMNAAAAAAPMSMATSSSSIDERDQVTTTDRSGVESSQYDQSVYQSNVPNISLFGAMNFAAATDEQAVVPSSASVSSSTPESSASVSSAGQSASFAINSNHSLPQLSFLMNNVAQFEHSLSYSDNSTTTPTPETIAVAYPFEHLLKCTNNFNDADFTDLSAMGRKLGAGGFGSVYLAHNVAADTPLAAVKRLHKNFEQVKQKFDLEIKILSQHRHENLVKLLGYAEDGGGGATAMEMCLMYEYVSGGNLERRLELCRRGQARLTIAKRLGIAVGVAKGIDYLHSAKLIHRDVKSANVLLTVEDIPKLCDFGLLRPLNSRTTTMAVGSSGYMAPEIVRGTYDYEKVDIFAFGVLQLELLTGLAVLCAERREDLVSYVEKVGGNEANITHLLDVNAGDWTDLGQRWYTEIVIDALKLSPNQRSGIVECLQRLEQIVQREVMYVGVPYS